MHRAIEDFFQPIGLDPAFVGTVFATEDGFQSGHIQQVARSIDQTLIDLIEFMATVEQQVTAVFKLKGAIGKTKLRTLLFCAG